MLRPSSEAQVAEVQANLKQQFKQPKTEIRNTVPAQSLETTSLLQFRGQQFRVPAVGWKEGLELQRMYLQLQNLQQVDERTESIEQLEILEKLMYRMFTFFKRLCRPISIWQRITWRWQTPFVEATQQELGELLGFFSACRMKSSVRFTDSTEM